MVPSSGPRSWKVGVTLKRTGKAMGRAGLEPSGNPDVSFRPNSVEALEPREGEWLG